MNKSLEIIEEKGNFDRRKFASNWQGHMGAASFGEGLIFLNREYSGGANFEKLTIKKWGKGIRVFLLDEEGRTTTRIFREISFSEAAAWLAGQSDEDFQGGPTYIYRALFLPKLVEETTAWREEWRA